MPQFDTPINTNDQSLDRVLSNPLPLLLTLTRNGLNPALRSALEDVARTQAGKLLIARLNTTENPAAARRFGAQGNTMLISWKNGTELARLPNPTPDQVRAAADHVLGNGPAPRVAPTPPADAHPIAVSQANFEQEVLRRPEPVVVDFWAPWCGPCLMIAPTLEKLAREYAGKVRIAKLNVDENQELSYQYGVQGIPYLVMFKGGKPVQRIVGAHPEPSLRSFIERGLL
jgi:thioredoxin 1